MAVLGRGHDRAAIALLPVLPHRDRQAMAEVAFVVTPQLLVHAQPDLHRVILGRVEVGHVVAAATAGVQAAQAIHEHGRPGHQALFDGGADGIAAVTVVVAELAGAQAPVSTLIAAIVGCQRDAVGGDTRDTRLHRGIRIIACGGDAGMPLIAELPAQPGTEAGIADVVVGAVDEGFGIGAPVAVARAHADPQRVDGLVLEIHTAPISERDQAPAVVQHRRLHFHAIAAVIVAQR
ncbi:hypothetical protein D3C71_1145620 [compost metagenome]